MQEDIALIDRITYMVSLASQPETIDPLLDNFRVITARWRPDQPLSAEDRAELLSLKGRLEKYLMYDDPLRKFTPQTLESRLKNRFSAKDERTWGAYLRTPAWSLIAVWLNATIAFVLGFVSSNGLDIQTRAALGGALFIIALYIGICWFYVSALRNFKSELLKAYGFVCAGILFTGLGATQFPITAIFNLADQPLFRYGGFLGFFAVSCVSLYIGIRIFAKLLQVKSKLTSLPYVTATTVLASLTVALLPHMSRPNNEFLFDFSLVCLAICIVTCIFAGILAYRTAATVTKTYGQGLRWLGITLLLVSIGSAISGIFIYANGQLYGTIQLVFTNVPFVVSGYTMLQAGYLFKKQADA